MYQRYGGGNMDEGWSRLMFEQFNIPVKPLMDAEIRKGDLNASYDAIILPADSMTAMTGETPAAAAGGRGGGGGGAAAAVVAGWARPSGGATPPAYRSGFGAEGVKALQAFVQKGGTLVTFGQAGDLPIQRFNLPVRNVVAGLASKEFWSPGSTLRVRFDPRIPAGVRHAARGLRALSSPAARPTRSRRRARTSRSFVTFVEREILQSGWLLGEGVIAGRPRRSRSRTATGEWCCLASVRSTAIRRTARSS